MLMKTKDARIWNLIWNHMSHDAARKKSTFWTEKTKNVIKRLKVSFLNTSRWGLTQGTPPMKITMKSEVMLRIEKVQGFI